MTQQFHFWVYTQDNRKQGLEELFVAAIFTIAIIHNSCGSNPSVHQQ